jgi:hypothetical protein
MKSKYKKKLCQTLEKLFKKKSNTQEKPPMELSSSENQSLREELDRVKAQLALSQITGEYTAN